MVALDAVHPSRAARPRRPPRDLASTELRRAQSWEDADVVLRALQVQPGDACLSVVSGGDNTLSLLVEGPERVVALSTSPADLACLELKMAAFRALNHPALLELLGARPSTRRRYLYGRARDFLSPSARKFWDDRPDAIAHGVGNAGRLEQLFAFLRRYVLPATQSKETLAQLGGPLDSAQRRTLFEERFMNWRWRLLLRGVLSRSMLERFGCDTPGVQALASSGQLVDVVCARFEQLMVDQDPSQNPYLHWLLHGSFGDVLPHALRPENFELIQHRLDRIELRRASVETHLEEAGPLAYDRFHLGSIHARLSVSESLRLMTAVAHAGRRGGRVVHWELHGRGGVRAALASVTRLRPLLEVERYGTRVAKDGLGGDLVVSEIG